jgi:hypothetical protein
MKTWYSPSGITLVELLVVPLVRRLISLPSTSNFLLFKIFVNTLSRADIADSSGNVIVIGKVVPLMQQNPIEEHNQERFPVHSY